MKRYRIDWRVFLAALNVLVALIVFIVQIWGVRAAWPGNGWALAWLSISIVLWALTVDEERI